MATTNMRAADMMHLALGAPDQESVELTATAHDLLREALDLVGAGDARDVVELALRELCERQRFLAWVAARDG